jgi:hypothetical protein
MNRRHGCHSRIYLSHSELVEKKDGRSRAAHARNSTQERPNLHVEERSEDPHQEASPTCITKRTGINSTVFDLDQAAPLTHFCMLREGLGRGRAVACKAQMLPM